MYSTVTIPFYFKAGIITTTSCLRALGKSCFLKTVTELPKENKKVKFLREIQLKCAFALRSFLHIGEQNRQTHWLKFPVKDMLMG